jgi:MoaA/NifB/PqqE/SkfB family radical SAM enzyme
VSGKVCWADAVLAAHMVSFRRLVQAFKLMQGVLSGNTAYTGPFFLTLDLTERCNLRCLACPYHSPDMLAATNRHLARDMPYELVLRVCKEVRSMGGWRLLLIGHGEPLLHPRIYDIIAAGKTEGLQAFLTTNGTLLDEISARLLVASGLDQITISLWANSPEDYGRNHPGTPAATFHKVVHGVKLLAQEKQAQGKTQPHIILHQPLTRHDFGNIGRFADLALSTGCDAISLSPLNTRRGRLKAHELSTDEVAAVCRLLKQLHLHLRPTRLAHNIDDVLVRYRFGKAIWEKYSCYIGYIDARVKTNGEVAPCNLCELSMGSLDQSSLREIWNGPRFREFRQRVRTPQGLHSFDTECDCEYCCHLPANRRLHPFFRMLGPLVKRKEGNTHRRPKKQKEC